MHTMTFANRLTVDEGGWAQLAPFGDYPGQAMMRSADGSITKFPAIQRLDRAAAEAMVAKFRSPWQRLKRYFTGCPIYAGHPDVPAFAKVYPDKTAKGMIVELEARAEGLFCRPVFTNEGSDLVEARKLRALSAYWSANEVGEQPGADGKVTKIFRPEVLHSAGLTNFPNLPVQLLNECFRTGSEGESGKVGEGESGKGDATGGSDVAAAGDSRGPNEKMESGALEFVTGAGNRAVPSPLTPALSPGERGNRESVVVAIWSGPGCRARDEQSTRNKHHQYEQTNCNSVFGGPGSDAGE